MVTVLKPNLSLPYIYSFQNFKGFEFREDTMLFGLVGEHWEIPAMLESRASPKARLISRLFIKFPSRVCPITPFLNNL